MKRALVTGASGFVGNYLTKELLAHDYEVFGGTRSGSPNLRSDIHEVTIRSGNKKKIIDTIEKIKPTVIFHLSGQSSVMKSWSKIEETFETNLMGTIELFEAIRCSSLRDSVKIVSIGSSEEYGLVDKQPISEDAHLNPINPYGISKSSTGKLALLYHKLHDMQIVHVRPFNHIGPGQSLGFVTSDFAKQITDIQKGIIDPIIHVGDLKSKRDFTDVRDIVRAYRLVSEKGLNGEVYNVCSGACSSIQSILDGLLSLSSVDIEVIIDNKKIRPSNIAEYYGSNNKLNVATGWAPQISLNHSLRDIYDYWLNEK
jgi:GDP-4-dehydro-6-deoxy-D-mannose reductase